jgi:nitrite reductase/ring-hydroxylating ferredoxin subunit
MLLKNCWYVAALDHELIDGKLLSRRLLGEHVLLFRGESGQLFALNDRCPHRGALLSRGRLEGDAILADAPLAHFRRLLGKLLDAEQAEASGQPSGTRSSSATR